MALLRESNTFIVRGLMKKINRTLDPRELTTIQQVIDALDDIFLKFKKNSYSYPMTYKFGTQKKQNTSFQKRESVFSFLKTHILPYL